MNVSEQWRPPANRWERVLTVSLVVLVVGLGVGLVLAWRSPDPFDPLLFDPQRIELVDNVTGDVRVPTVAGFEGVPAVSVDDPVPVVGTRCSSADEEINVVGTVWWVKTDPRGVRVQTLDGFATRVPPGCFPLRFSNEIPEEVRRRVVDGGIPAQWRIVGTVAPTRSGGVPANWQTETFWIIP